MIKKATAKDLEGIYQLISIGAKNGKVLPRSREELKKVIKSFFIWQEKGEVLGCASLEVYSKRLAELRSLVVLPKYQNKGIGSALVKKCVEKAKKLKIYEVLAVTDKVSLFEKLGFSKQLSYQWPMFIRLRKSYL